MFTLRPSIKNLFVLVFALAMTLSYLNNLQLPNLSLYIGGLFSAALIALAAWTLGTHVFGTLNDDDLGLAEQFPFVMLAGFGTLSLLMFGAGMVGGWHPLPVRLAISAIALFAWPRRIRLMNTFSSLAWPTGPRGFRTLLYLGIGIAFILSFAPITYYDSLVYHLAMPGYYIQAGRWVGHPELIYSAFPQNMEMLWTLALLVHSDITVNLLGSGFGILLLLLIAQTATRYISDSAGSVAAGLVAAMPAFILLCSGGYVDLGLAAFQFGSLALLIRWADTKNSRWLLLAGLLAGFAMGTKYTGFLGGAAGLVLIVWTRRYERRSLPGDIALYLGSATLVVLPWLLKNLHYVGNPVFPFLYKWGLHAPNPWTTDAATGYFRGLTEYESRGLFQIPRLLWDVAVHAQDYGGGMDVLGDYGWIPFIAFLPVLALTPSVRISKVLLAYLALLLIPWAMTRPVLRFLLPALPVVAILLGHGWINGIEKMSYGFRWASKTLLIAMLLSGGFVFVQVMDVLTVYRPIFGLETRHAYLERCLSYYAAARYMNEHLSADSNTYVVGDQRGYYYKTKVRVTPVFNSNPLTEWADQAATEADLHATLRAQGFTHLLINRSEMLRLATYGAYRFSAHGEEVWNNLKSRRLKLLYHDNHCDLFEL